MIPMTRDHKLKYEYDEVTYIFHPPIGELEIEFNNLLTSGGDNLKENYQKAEESVIEALKPEKYKRKDPGHMKLVEAKVLELMKEDEDRKYKRDIKRTSSIIDLILYKWESKKDIPPISKHPSEMLTIPLQTKLFNWYWSQYDVTEDEAKK